MINLNLPAWVFQILQKSLKIKEYDKKDLAVLKQKLSRFNSTSPLVSIIIPAWNEEEGILHTLHSLAESNTAFETELIIVVNNCSDGTADLVKQLGIQTMVEIKQGVGHARTCGLMKAKGTYILTADSDTLYHPGWITVMTNALLEGKNKPVYCVHGSYSFLPGINAPRWKYGIYEIFSKVVIKRKEKTRPYLNVLGFNCGFIREKGIELNGYDIKSQRIFRGKMVTVDGEATEDGMMALRLQQAGGKIQPVTHNDAKVWTSDRRIQMDGGIRKAFIIRVKKYLFKT